MFRICMPIMSVSRWLVTIIVRLRRPWRPLIWLENKTKNNTVWFQFCATMGTRWAFKGTLFHRAGMSLDTKFNPGDIDEELIADHSILDVYQTSWWILTWWFEPAGNSALVIFAMADLAYSELLFTDGPGQIFLMRRLLQIAIEEYNRRHRRVLVAFKEKEMNRDLQNGSSFGFLALAAHPPLLVMGGVVFQLPGWFSSYDCNSWIAQDEPLIA